MTSGETEEILAVLPVVDPLSSSANSEATQASAAEKSVVEDKATGDARDHFVAEDTIPPPEIVAVDDLPIIDA